MGARKRQKPDPEPLDKAKVARGRRFRRALEDLWTLQPCGQHDHHNHYGFVTGLSDDAGIGRQTVSSWFSEEVTPKEPTMESFQALADYFKVTRVELIAIYDGVSIPDLSRAAASATEEEIHRARTRGRSTPGKPVLRPLPQLPGNGE